MTPDRTCRLGRGLSVCLLLVGAWASVGCEAYFFTETQGQAHFEAGRRHVAGDELDLALAEFQQAGL